MHLVNFSPNNSTGPVRTEALCTGLTMAVVPEVQT